ncbi:hypothetical protein [Vibrio sp. YIC-376]|uniref:hypothetical protein n=1 Tax=Vibrio sp. YIC-376 TaxID=3136162 RepID=UPI00402A9DAB
MLLPEPEHRKGIVEHKNLCIEFMFRDEVLTMPFDNGGRLEISEPTIKLVVGNKPISLSAQELNGIPNLPLEHCKSIGKGKAQFVEDVVKRLEVNDFDGFQSLFDIFDMILGRTQSSVEDVEVEELPI